DIVEVEATLDPESAPKPALAITDATPAPPGKCPIHLSMESNKSSAIPLLDKKCAIKINKGMVVNVKSFTLLKLKLVILDIKESKPFKYNKPPEPTIIRTKPIGIPIIINDTNAITAISSINFYPHFPYSLLEGLS